MNPRSLAFIYGICIFSSISIFHSSGKRKPNDDPISDRDRALISGDSDEHTSKRSEKPNIILIMTDDQDSELGSMNFMPKSLRILRDGGAHFTNAFVTTPMCCPSRSSMLTGLYSHNHNVYTNNNNCSSPLWQRTHETRNFGTYLANAGYRTGYFGKYLNEYNGTYIPPGWSEWVGLVKNTRFYNYTLNFNGKKIRHGDNYYQDYFTDLIANDSVTFLKKSKQYFPNRPVAMVLSMPAPHGPEDAAPQYQHMFKNITTHRTPSWNYAPNPDKQWLLQYTPKMEPIHIAFTDMLHRKRLQTLQSVDDAVEKVYNELKALGELDNTYIIYTSDHGYHLGQFGLVKGKAMPYEMDIRVPFYVRGPKAPAGVKISSIVINIDLAPTILDMGGVQVPEHMDGRSILPVLDTASQSPDVKNGYVKRKKAWRDSFLVERGKITAKKLKDLERNEAEINDMTLKERRLQMECQRPEYQPPCQGKQRWACEKSPVTGKYRMYKCRINKVYNEVIRGNSVCRCKSKNQMSRKERLLQKKFLKTHLSQASSQKLKFLRTRRSLFDRMPSRGKRSTQTEGDTSEKSCHVLPNNTVICGQKTYYSMDMWQVQKNELDKLIKEYRQRLEKLRALRKLFRKSKKVNFDFDLNITPTMTSTTEETPAAAPVVTTAAPTNSTIDDDLECTCEPMQNDSKASNSIVAKRQLKKERRMMRRQKKLERREKRRQKKRKQKQDIECNAPNMKCFTQTNDHWKTPPFWNSKLKRKGRGRRKDPNCWAEGVECHLMVNDHWKVPPKWTLGPFCFCPNSNNNTYWCVRTINDTHNFLYCEFVTGFISFYDMKQDPYQLRNAVFDLDFGRLQQLHDMLNKLRSCKGGRECTMRTRPQERRRIRGTSQSYSQQFHRHRMESLRKRRTPRWKSKKSQRKS